MKAQGFGCRQAPRLRLGMRARLITPDRSVPVILDDLSDRGAKITLPEPHDFVVAVLRWMDVHAFADVRWREGLAIGLEFATPLEPAVIERTRLYAPELVPQLDSAAANIRYC